MSDGKYVTHLMNYVCCRMHHYQYRKYVVMFAAVARQGSNSSV